MDVEKREIDGTVYVVTLMDAVSALRLQTKLVKILGESAFSVFAGNKGASTAEKIQQVFPRLFSNFDDALVTETVLSLFEKGVMYEHQTPQGPVNRELDFNKHFQGKPLLMWKVAAFILEANFGLGELFKFDSPTTGESDKDNKGA